MYKTTLKDIAKVAGVSAMTVSKALNGKQGVSEEQRNAILQIAEQLNYSPNQIAKSLRCDKTKTIGVVLSDSSEMVTSKVFRGIQDEAQSKGYSVIVANTDHHADLERDAVKTLLEKQIDGLVLVAPVLTEKQDVEKLHQYSVPFVFLMRDSEFEANSVINNNYTGGYESAIHLINQGCKSYLILALENSKSCSERERGYAKAFSENGIKQDRITTVYVKPFIDEGYSAICKAISENCSFDCVICGCDTVAIGAMEALLENKIRIPDDVCLIGYDGIDLGKYLRVPLSTMAQPFYQIGREGTEILLDNIDNPELPAVKKVLPSKLIVRESSTRRKQNPERFRALRQY